MRSLHPEVWTSVIDAVEPGFSEKLGPAFASDT